VGIYRISTYAAEKRISFNQFLIDDEEPALIHAGTFPMYDDVRSAIAQVLHPSRLRHVIVPHVEADECGGMGRFVAEALMLCLLAVRAPYWSCSRQFLALKRRSLCALRTCRKCRVLRT
jgi:flavorubredoxin